METYGTDNGGASAVGGCVGYTCAVTGGGTIA